MSYLPSLGMPELFQPLPEPLQQKLKSLGFVQTYSADQHIQSRGDRTRGFSIIESGSVCFGKMDEEGKFIVSAVFKAGQCYGEFTLFADLPRTHDGVAVEQTAIRHISKVEFDSVLASEPALSVHILSSLTMQLHSAMEWIDDLRRYPLKYRLAKSLLYIYSHQNNPCLTVTQSELADMMGVSRVAIGKELSFYKEQGFLEIKYGSLVLVGADAFREWLHAFAGLEPV